MPISEDLLARSSLKEPVQTEAPKSQQEVVKGKRTKTSINYRVNSNGVNPRLFFLWQAGDELSFPSAKSVESDKKILKIIRAPRSVKAMTYVPYHLTPVCLKLKIR